MNKLKEIMEILIKHEHCNPNNCSVAGEIRNGHVLDMLRIHHSEYEKLKGERDKFKKALITHSLKCKDIQAFLELSDEYKSASSD